MHKEEIRNGKLYHQEIPGGGWKLVSYETVLDRLVKAEKELIFIHKKLLEIRKQT